MKDTFRFSAVMCAVSLLAVSGCVDEKLNRPVSGTGIAFGANASYADGTKTKTEYGGYDNDSNPSSQSINWVSTDQVSIYSPESPNVTQSDYGITNINESNKSKAHLASKSGGLQWGNEETQNFYAIYPAPESMSNEAIKNVVKFSNGTLTGYVPVNQAHTISYSNGQWTAKPVMDYLYMSAINNVTMSEVDADSGVDLKFVPLTTTLEITINGTDSTVPIVQVNVLAGNNENIAGYFTCDLVNGSQDADGYPICEYTSSSTVRNMVTISTYYNENGEQKPMALASGESITFNVFLLPHEELTNLRLRIVGLNTTGKNMSLSQNTTPITLKPHQKTRIEVNAPSFTDSNVNNWMSVIDDNVYVSQLSIPGTANSFSFNYSGDDKHLYKTQEASFEAQWNAGIRCFELKCPNSSSNDLSNSTLQCNGQDLGLTFGKAVDMIWSRVQNSGEFAMIIPFFENTNGRSTNVTDFANDLNQFFTNHTSYKYVTYGRNLTLEEARGSLMFVARITSEEDDDAIRNSMPNPVQGVFVENWGSLKDNWQRRGYTINGSPVDNWARARDYDALQNTNTMEHYLVHRSEGANASWTPTTIPTKGTVNFGHATTREDGSEGTAYIQDWSRVVKTGEAQTKQLYIEDRGWFNDDYYYYAYWPASYDEKFSDVKNTFLKAIADNGSGALGSTFYINSLDGYYIDWTVENSYKPYVEGFGEDWTAIGRYYQFTLNGGGCGDIASFAEDINNDFYNYILDYGADNIYGSMNIVLMDMAYQGTGGTYLPSVIINNNFRFPLLTKDPAGGTSTSASSK